MSGDLSAGRARMEERPAAGARPAHPDLGRRFYPNPAGLDLGDVPSLASSTVPGCPVSAAPGSGGEAT